MTCSRFATELSQGGSHGGSSLAPLPLRGGAAGGLPGSQPRAGLHCLSWHQRSNHIGQWMRLLLAHTWSPCVLESLPASQELLSVAVSGGELRLHPCCLPPLGFSGIPGLRGTRAVLSGCRQEHAESRYIHLRMHTCTHTLMEGRLQCGGGGGQHLVDGLVGKNTIRQVDQKTNLKVGPQVGPPGQGTQVKQTFGSFRTILQVP